MKTMAIFSAVLMVLATAPVFAGSCGGGCDKDKDEKATISSPQLFCGGEKGDSEKPEMMCDGCGCKKDKGCDKPKPEPELFCGGGNGDNLAPEPDLFCGGGCDNNKDKTKT